MALEGLVRIVWESERWSEVVHATKQRSHVQHVEVQVRALAEQREWSVKGVRCTLPLIWGEGSSSP